MSAVLDIASRSRGRDRMVRAAAEAVGAYRTRRFARALDLVRGILRRSPNERLALEIGGRAAEAAQDWQAAITFWARLAFLENTRFGPRYQLAFALTQSGAWGVALKFIEELLEERPDHAPTLLMKLRALSKLAQAEALAEFTEELRARSWTASDGDLLARIAEELFGTGNSALAKRWLEWLPQSGIDPNTVLHLQARIAAEEGQHQTLVRLGSHLEEVGSERQKLEARLYQARAAHEAGDLETAASLYARVHRQRPDHEESATYLLRRHLAFRDIAAAEEILAAGRRVPALAATCCWWQALVEAAKGDVPKAWATLEAGIERFGEDVQFVVRAADVHADKDDLAGAIALLERGLERMPKATRLLGRLLQCRAAMGEEPNSLLVLCDRLLELDPRHQDALLQRGNVLNRLARRHEALAAFETGATLFPNNTTFWRSAVSTSLMLGDEDAARALLERARKQLCDTAQGCVALAEIFDAAGDEKEARRMVAAALKADPGLKTARQTAMRLYTGYGDFDAAWELALDLQEPAQRHIRIVRTYAQIAAGRYAAGVADGATPAGGRFPDILFDRIASGLVPGPHAGTSETRSAIMHVTSTLGAGGAERQVAGTVSELAARDCGGGPIRLVVEDLNPLHGRDFFLPAVRNAGIGIHCLDDELKSAMWRDRLADYPDVRPAVAALAAMPTEVVKLALPLFALLLQERPRVVHLWQDTVCVAGGTAALLAGVPRIILSTRSTRPVERQRARPYLLPGFKALLSRPEATLISNSRHGARDYEDWLQLPAGSVRVVHNGYDFEAIRARADDAVTRRIRSDLHIPEGASVLGGVMRCSFEKRPELWTEVAIELASRRSDFYGILVGEGPMLPQLRERVREAGYEDRIRFVGQQRPVEPWMQAMDILFLSSMTEGLPNVLIEAQSLGVPVATMRVGGAPETVTENETALVVDEGRIDAIAGPIGALLFDLDRRSRFAAAGPAWVEAEFSIGATLEKLTRLYREGGAADDAASAAAASPPGSLRPAGLEAARTHSRRRRSRASQGAV